LESDILEKMFYCYSKPLKDLLIESGCNCIADSIHSRTKKMFWIFNGTEKLNDVLTIWRSRRGRN